ncbi:hypothetical protein [Falsiruegeria mediterranea]|uniref:Uncharacterized protein n=1 Tax=Falsiruegeria mediterranea M17 TaxID=1200281 RepID=A0A2R8CAH1_9RHOB|nr:hypothetical protein [Falsiruegeria mediterranea]SPJ29422.1 hypothetical protein TRM7615_02940 [Falsiruegeria mediterranea M17]
MQRRLSIALVVTLLPTAFLWLWKLTYGFSDWAAIWLLFIAAMIFLGNWSITIDRWKAERGIFLRSGSWLAGWLTGRTGAFLSSTLLVFLLVPALAWNALTMSGAEVVVSLALVFASAWLFLWMQSFLIRHFIPPFDRIVATGPSAWMVGLPFSIILFFVTWYAQSIPAEMLTADFSVTLRSRLGELPERRGWISEMLAFGYAFEASKMWLVVQMRDYPLIAILFNLDMALFGFFAARASVVMTHFVETHYHGTPNAPV